MDATTQLNAALGGRYTVVRQIGAGGMATVYLARDIRHDRSVALKLLNPELGAVLGVERFLSEIKVTANLQHPNLLPLFDSGAADGLLFYVMPYVEGESLRARLDRERQLPVDEAVRIATAIAGALDYAHRHHVIHRDLKPENILLHEGQPVVADFGIALAVSNAGGDRITQTGLSLGTPQYMSPEQATGDRVIDGRTDQYSLAAMLYEMLTCDPPHVGSTSQAVIARVLTERPRDIRLSRDTVPEHVAMAVDRALAKLPADRFATASAFADALKTHLTASAGPMLTSSRGAKSIGRRRLASPVPWMIATGLAVAAVIALVASGRRETDGHTVRFGIVGATNTSAAPGAVVAASADGRTVVYSSNGGTNDVGLWVRRVDELKSRPIEGAETAEQPFMSPDGQWLGFVAGGQLRKAPLAGGPAAVVSDLSGPLLGASWGTNDVIVVGIDSRLGTVPASGGRIQRLTTSDTTIGELQVWPFVLPGGKTALYGRWRNSNAMSRIAKVDLATGKTTVFENLSGTRPVGLLDGWLVYAGVGGVLTAVRFDEGRAEPTGDPIPLAEHPQSGAVGAGRAALSSTGLLIYQAGFDKCQMMLVDMHGSMRPLSPEVRAFALPRFSPDGKLVAVQIAGESSNDIWVYTMAGGTLTRLTTEGSVNDRPEWTPDSKRILFRSDRNGPIALWTQPVDHNGAASLLYNPPKLAIFEGLITPDGKSLVFRSGSLSSADIWQTSLVPRDTGRKAIATTPYLEWAPRLSPDGHWIAFSSDESRPRQVYVQPFPGPGARVQVSVNGGDYPVWSRDQRFLFFRNGQRMMRAAVSTSGSFSVGARELLFESDLDMSPGHANYDVTPDGQYLLMLKPSGSDAQTIVAYDWQYSLRAQVSSKNQALTAQALVPCPIFSAGSAEPNELDLHLGPVQRGTLTQLRALGTGPRETIHLWQARWRVDQCVI